ncbi:MAG: DNA-processing protein DprA [Patescibacteria group bacterium]
MTSPYAIALSHFAAFGSRTYVRLFENFETYAHIWHATPEALTAAGLNQKVTDQFVAWRQTINPDHLAEQVRALNIDTLDRNDPRFPQALQTIFDPPIILYVRGSLPTTTNMLGVVGSRDATTYGLSTAQSLSSELSQAGLVIVSGLARGIDLAAHTGAMEANGKTIAVLAHGHEQLKGAKLAFSQRILQQGGAIISEQPPHLSAQHFHFPIRNRIIAGLCRGVLIVEAELPSGTLHTAQAAINAHREVFAIPGPINSPTSVGTNKLLQDGAHVTTSATDILTVLGLTAQTPPVTPSLLTPPPYTPNSPAEAALLPHLSKQPIHIDDLAKHAQLPISEVLGTLTILEIHGKVRHLGQMFYSL